MWYIILWLLHALCELGIHHQGLSQTIIPKADPFTATETEIRVSKDRIFWKNQTAYNSARKSFTFVAKTRANLTIYSRKPENYNGTIIFEIDIMKNSAPINLNLCQTWLFHSCFGCFFGFDMAKSVNFKLSGDEFFMM